MDADVKEKIGYLESVLGQYIVNSDMALTRLERNISNLSSEMKDFKEEMKVFKEEMKVFKDEMRAQSINFTGEMTSFKDEMKDFKDEMRAQSINFTGEMTSFKDEMKDFKDEMRAQSINFTGEMTSFKDEMKDFKDEMRAQSINFTGEMTSFKDEMQDFKDEMKDFKAFVLADIEDARAERKAMNKRWGELANKMGTVVEDIVAPCVGGVAREYFQVDELDFFAVRLQIKNASGTRRREFDVVAESEKYLFVVETKSTPRTSYIQDFIDFIPEIGEWFPRARSKTVIPIFSSLYIPEDSVRFLTNHRIFALAMKDDNMDLLNPELINQ